MDLESPEMDLVKNINTTEIMGDECQTEFRSVVAKLTSIGQHSRPYICFEAKALSSRYGKATKQDLIVALKKIFKLLQCYQAEKEDLVPSPGPGCPVLFL